MHTKKPALVHHSVLKPSLNRGTEWAVPFTCVVSDLLLFLNAIVDSIRTRSIEKNLDSTVCVERVHGGDGWI